MVQIIQSRTRHGWNLNGQNVPNWQYIKEQAKKNPPRWTLIMDNGDKAREWKDEIGGEVTVRSWGTREADVHYDWKPQAAAQQMARESEKTADCWQYWKMNEPSADAKTWHVLQDWLIDYAKEAKRLGRKVTTNGLAIGKNWDYPEFIKAGHVDKLIKYWADNRDTFILNVHSYVTGSAWSPVMPNYPANLFDLHAMRNGRYTAHINWDTYEPVMWYYREAWVTNVRAKEVIGEVMDFIIDECWFDYHASVHQQFVTLPDGRRVKMEDELKARYGDPLFEREMKGILGQRKFGEWVITGQHNTPVPDEAYCDWLVSNYQWLEDEYPDNALAFMNFTLNPNWRYPYSGGGGFGHDATPLIHILLPKMALIKPRSVQPTPQPQPIPAPAPQPEPTPDPVTWTLERIQGNGVKVNVRQQPSVDSPAIGIIQSAPTVTTVAVSSAPEQDPDGMIWREIEFNGVRGWAAFRFIVEAPAPTVDLRPYRRAFEDIHDALAELQRQDRLAELMRQIEDILDTFSDAA